MVSVAQGHSASRLGSCAQPSGLFKPQAELQVPPSSPEVLLESIVVEDFNMKISAVTSAH